MTIGQKLHAVLDHLTPGHKTVPGSVDTTTGTTATGTTTTETHAHTSGAATTPLGSGPHGTTGTTVTDTHTQGTSGVPKAVDVANAHAAGKHAHATSGEAGAVSGGVLGTGHHSHTTDTASTHTGGAIGSGLDGATVCVPGNVAAPVPVGEKKFIVTEDHAVAKERVERWTEHQPVEREFVTKVEETGKVSAGTTHAEGAIGAERVVNEHTCYPTNTTTVTGVAGDTKPTTGATTGTI